MTLPGGLARSFRGRSSFLLVSGGLLAIILILVAAACGGDGAKNPAAPTNASPVGQEAPGSTLVWMYSSPT